MQNKPNFLKHKRNVTLLATKDYENETAFRLQKYKPKQSQSVFFSAVNVKQKQSSGQLLIDRTKRILYYDIQ